MTVYAIGGLGADERVFSELELDFDFIPLPWITPGDGETLQNYAKRFSDQINTSSPFSIIGVSFGGILAIELTKTINVFKTVLISSASSRQDIPWMFRILGQAGIINILPLELVKPPRFVSNWLFGVNHAKNQKLLNSIIADTNPRFLKWALSEIMKWDSQQISNEYYRIHGSSDRLLRCKNHEGACIIKSGGHFMIVEQAREISLVLNKIFNG